MKEQRTQRNDDQKHECVFTSSSRKQIENYKMLEKVGTGVLNLDTLVTNLLASVWLKQIVFKEKGDDDEINYSLIR